MKIGLPSLNKGKRGCFSVLQKSEMGKFKNRSLTKIFHRNKKFLSIKVKTHSFRLVMAVSEDFLATLLSRKVLRYSSELNLFPSSPSDLQKDSLLPVAWRSTETHLKIYFQKVPIEVEKGMSEQQLPLGVALVVEDKKGKILCLPWKNCGVHDADTSDDLDDRKPLAMSLSYDNESDALVIYLVDPEHLPIPCFPSHTDDGIFIIDVDANGKIISIEILDARKHLDILF